MLFKALKTVLLTGLVLSVFFLTFSTARAEIKQPVPEEGEVAQEEEGSEFENPALRYEYEFDESDIELKGLGKKGEEADGTAAPPAEDREVEEKGGGEPADTGDTGDVLMPRSVQAPEPFVELLREVLAYFRPLEGTIVQVTGEKINADLGTDRGLMPGMRLDVLRKDGVYNHPLTGERIVKVEEPVGRVEVTEAGESRSRLETVSGGPFVPGDVVRISQAPVRMLFVQGPGVSWSLAEEYYETLLESNRFGIIDVPYIDSESIRREARKSGADIVLMLTQEKTSAGSRLRQRIFWADEERLPMLASSEVLIERTHVADLSFGDRLFAPSEGDTLVAFELPFDALHLRSGDIDGDGVEEAIISTGTDVYFYSAGERLVPALGGIEINGDPDYEHIWLDAGDLDGDGAAEVLVVERNEDDGEIRSRLFGYQGGAISQLASWDRFARIIEGSLYGQEHSVRTGFSGRPSALENPLTGRKAPEPTLPDGVDLYDFVFVGAPVSAVPGKRYILAYNVSNRLLLLNRQGVVLWQSKEGLGGFINEYKEKQSTPMQKPASWIVPDPLVKLGVDTVVAIKRLPLFGLTPGMGYSGARALAYHYDPRSNAFQPRFLTSQVPGKVLGMAVVENKLLMLSRKLNIKKILEAKKITGYQIFIFPLGVGKGGVDEAPPVGKVSEDGGAPADE